jgi:predicted dehydrogenase
MSKMNAQNGMNRRDFLRTSTLAAAAAAAAPSIITVHAAPDDPIRVGLVGCGGRGMGAIGNVLAAGPNIKLVAIADLFPEKVESARKQLETGAQSSASWARGTETTELEGKIKIDPQMCFSGFDAYKKLLAVSDINYVILTTPPHFRSIHMKAAVEAGKHCFIEKPVAVDAPGIRTVLAAGEMAKTKGLGILAGTQRRHQENYVEVVKRIHDGMIGQITAARAYWNQASHTQHEKRKPEWTDMEWQLRNWIYFTWLSGDIIVEQHMHNIDVINWVLQAHPVKAYGMGGRQVRVGAEYGNIYDHFCVEFEYPGGVRMTSMCRQMDNCSDQIGEAVVGTKGASNCMNNITGENKFRFSRRFRNPYEQEHVDMVQGIRSGKPLNEAQSAAESNMAAIMGRESAYSGKTIDWDTAMENETSLAPAKYEFGPLAVAPVPMPGKYKFE